MYLKIIAALAFVAFTLPVFAQKKSSKIVPVFINDAGKSKEK